MISTNMLDNLGCERERERAIQVNKTKANSTAMLEFVI